MRLSRPTAIAGLIVVCCIGAAALAFENWRERATEEEKTRTALAAELRILDADLDKGVAENDLIRQADRARALFDNGTKTFWTQPQRLRFLAIDLDLIGIETFWNEEKGANASGYRIATGDDIKLAE
jgi:hypothetical protein